VRRGGRSGWLRQPAAAPGGAPTTGWAQPSRAVSRGGRGLRTNVVQGVRPVSTACALVTDLSHRRCRCEIGLPTRAGSSACRRERARYEAATGHPVHAASDGWAVAVRFGRPHMPGEDETCPRSQPNGQWRDAALPVNVGSCSRPAQTGTGEKTRSAAGAASSRGCAGRDWRPAGTIRSIAGSPFTRSTAPPAPSTASTRSPRSKPPRAPAPTRSRFEGSRVWRARAPNLAAGGRRPHSHASGVRRREVGSRTWRQRRTSAS
jgi:hypothetical protein